MTTYQSEVKTISSGEEVVFGLLSDLNNLGKLQWYEAVKEKIRVVEFDRDSCLLELGQFGKVGFAVKERLPYKSVSFQTQYLPVSIDAEFLLDKVDDNRTNMRIVLHAEIPSVLKMMVGKQLEEGVNALADLLVNLFNDKFQ